MTPLDGQGLLMLAGREDIDIRENVVYQPEAGASSGNAGQKG